MSKYRIDQFKSCGHMIDYFEDRMTLGQLLEYAYTGAAVRCRFADLEEIAAYTDQWYDLSRETLDDLKLDILPFSDDPNHDYMSVSASKI